MHETCLRDSGVRPGIFTGCDVFLWGRLTRSGQRGSLPMLVSDAQWSKFKSQPRPYLAEHMQASYLHRLPNLFLQL